MSSPYSGATPSGAPDVGPMTTPISTTTAGQTEMTQNYATDYTPGQQPRDTAGEPHSGSMGMPMTEAGRPDVEGTSVGALIGEVTKDLSTLMRQELDLAKAEMKVEAKKAGQGAGAFGAAGFAGYMVLMFLSFALWWALENVMDAGLAALIVAILWGIV